MSEWPEVPGFYGDPDKTEIPDKPLDHMHTHVEWMIIWQDGSSTKVVGFKPDYAAGMLSIITGNIAPSELKPFWISWWNDPTASFELHSPWWVTGSRADSILRTKHVQQSVCAAVMAIDEEAAKTRIVESYDLPVALEWRFVEERPSGWSPFSDRFRRADWMCWPVSAQASALGREGADD